MNPLLSFQTINVSRQEFTSVKLSQFEFCRKLIDSVFFEVSACIQYCTIQNVFEINNTIKVSEILAQIFFSHKGIVDEAKMFMFLNLRSPCLRYLKRPSILPFPFRSLGQMSNKSGKFV